MTPEGVSRFRNEIRAMADLSDTPGVLPIQDSCVPERTTRSNPAWLAMPVATLLTEQLGEGPAVRDVVDRLTTFREMSIPAVHWTLCSVEVLPMTNHLATLASII